jgi:hypothetical protein
MSDIIGLWAGSCFPSLESIDYSKRDAKENENIPTRKKSIIMKKNGEQCEE